MNNEETIAAIATAPGEGGVAIVRLSGPEVFRIADDVIRCSGPAPSERDGQTFLHGYLVDVQYDIDEVIVLIMKAPRSYTCENMIEIQGHGGHVLARRVLRRVLDAGARMAEPGEFTKRAFLNGRIDLMQAEAVLDLVRARSDRAAKAALEQLEGSLSNQFNTVYDALLLVAADLEATLDFPEEDIPSLEIDKIPSRLTPIGSAIDDLVAEWDEGHLLREGALVVIAGKPNVGKSTLLNGLLDTDRAIVSHRPGTTRDIIEEGFNLDGIPVRLVDTAGLREVGCAIEKEGIARARGQIEKADLQIYVMDASAEISQEDRDHLATLEPAKAVLVINKIDLGSTLEDTEFAGFTVVPASLIHGIGLDPLRAAMRERIEAGIDLTTAPHAVISERHRRLLLEAQAEISQATGILQEQAGDEALLATEHLRTALELIGQATGRTYEEDMLDNIFSRFCIGK